jgi:hypothetical protein
MKLWYPWKRKLGVPQGQSGCFTEEKNPLSLLDLELHSLHHHAHNLVFMLTGLPQLLGITEWKHKYQ